MELNKQGTSEEELRPPAQVATGDRVFSPGAAHICCPSVLALPLDPSPVPNVLQLPSAVQPTSHQVTKLLLHIMQHSRHEPECVLACPRILDARQVLLQLQLGARGVEMRTRRDDRAQPAGTNRSRPSAVAGRGALVLARPPGDSRTNQMPGVPNLLPGPRHNAR